MAISMISRSVVVIVGIITLFACGVYWYSKWWDRVQYLRWLSQRQQDLNAIGKRIHVYANSHGGGIPQSIQELTDLGILADTEVRFRENWRDVVVSRELRPVPSLAQNGDLFLMIETHDPPGNSFLVLRLEGYSVAFASSHYESQILQDNTRRREEGLPTIPP